MSVNSYGSPAVLNGSQQYIITNDIPYQGQFTPSEGMFPLQQQQQQQIPQQQQQQQIPQQPQQPQPQPMFSQQPVYPSVTTPATNTFPQQPAVFVPVSRQNYMNPSSRQQQQQIPTQQSQLQQQHLVNAYSPNYTLNPVSSIPTNVPNPQQYAGSMFLKQGQQQQQPQPQQQQYPPQSQTQSQPLYMNHIQQGRPFDPTMQQWIMTQPIPAGPPIPNSSFAPAPAPSSMSPSSSYSHPISQQQQHALYNPQQSVPHRQPQVNFMKSRRYGTMHHIHGNSNSNNSSSIDFNNKSTHWNNNNIESTNININTRFTELEKSKETLNNYIFDFLQKSKFNKSATIFKQEAKLNDSKNITQFEYSNTSKGFLIEWWHIFWDLFNTITKRGGTEVANKYYQIVSNQRRRDNSYKAQMLYAAKLQNLAEQRGEYGEHSRDPLSLLPLISKYHNTNSNNNIPNFEFNRTKKNNDYDNKSTNSNYNSNGNTSRNNNQNMNQKQIKPDFDNLSNGNTIPQKLPIDQQAKYVQLPLQQVQQVQQQQMQMQVQLQLQRQIEQQRQQQQQYQKRIPNQQQQQQSSVLYFGQAQNQNQINSSTFQQASPCENVNNISQWRSAQVYNNPMKSMEGFYNSVTDYNDYYNAGGSSDKWDTKSAVSKFSKQDQLDAYNNYKNPLNDKKVNNQNRQYSIQDTGEDNTENNFESVSNDYATLNNNSNLPTGDTNNMSILDNDLTSPQNNKTKKSRIKNKKPSLYDTKKKTCMKSFTPSVGSSIATTSKTSGLNKSKSESKIDFQSNGIMSNNNNMKYINSSILNTDTVLSPESIGNNGFNTSAVPSYVSENLTFTPQQGGVSPRTGDLPNNSSNSNINTVQSSFSADTNYTNKDKDSSHKSHRSSIKNTSMVHENGFSNTSFSQNKWVHQDKKVDNIDCASIKRRSSDSSLGIIDIKNNQFLTEEPGKDSKGKFIQHSRKRKEMNKNEKHSESSRKRGRKPKKSKTSNQDISEAVLDKDEKSRVFKHQNSSEKNERDKTIIKMGALSDTEEIFEENGKNQVKDTSLASSMNPDILQSSFKNDTDDFVDFNFSNLEAPTTDHSSLNAIIPNGNSVESFSILSGNLNIGGGHENDTSNKKGASPNNVEGGDIDFNFIDWQ
ncbi:uncharacterized protein PWA37_001734 [Arxiozyma heterogenica]|uniref:uncharacterized protein n=1 Tax=Arxiozyma heterogenica TaxID=278026 RepID=UPI002F0D4DEA